jgi:hypothetical protein
MSRGEGYEKTQGGVSERAKHERKWIELDVSVTDAKAISGDSKGATYW